MERTEMISGIILHLSDADQTTRNNVVEYAMSIDEPNRLERIYDYVVNIC